MEKFVTVPQTGVSFNLEVSGNSPQIIFVHGFSESKRSWEYLWQELAPDYSALRYDLRGFGKTKLVSNELFSHAEDLKSLLEFYGLKQCVLVGISMGGGAALKTALDYPELVSHLVLFCPAIDGWQWSDQWRSGWRVVCDHARQGDLAKARELWWQYPIFDSVRGTPLEEKVKETIELFHGDQWVKNYQLPAESDIERICNLECPTLVLTGGRDMPDFIEIGEFMANQSPLVKRLHFPDQGHLLSCEIPEVVAKEIRDFIGEAK